MTGQKYDNNHNLGKCPEKTKNKQKQGLEGLRQRSLKNMCNIIQLDYEM